MNIYWIIIILLLVGGISALIEKTVRRLRKRERKIIYKSSSFASHLIMLNNWLLFNELKDTNKGIPFEKILAHTEIVEIKEGHIS